MIPPPSQNTVGVCNKITLLMPCYIMSSKLVNRLKIIDTPKQVSDIFLFYCYFEVHLF
jgi:hypothetical protein